MRTLSAGEWGQFAVILILCLIAAAAIVRMALRRAKARCAPKKERASDAAPLRFVVVAADDLTPQLHEVQEMIDRLRRQVELQSPPELTP